MEGFPSHGMDALEQAARAAIDALKEAAIIRSTNADWRLVAAAQAMRRCDYTDEFDAATAMGKLVNQRRDVENWSKKLEQLEQRTAAAGDSRAANRTSLIVDPAWISKNLTGIQQLDTRSLVLSPGKQHGKRTISAISSTPGGSVRDCLPGGGRLWW